MHTPPPSPPDTAAAIPQPWDETSPHALDFAARIGSAQRPLLLCDYDGTLAPFRENKMEAVPYPGVAERLERILDSGTEVAFISGRPVAELITLLPLAGRLEIWGMHGWQHRSPEGTVRLLEPTAAQREAFNDAESRLRAARLGHALERKAASVAVHWRAAGAHSQNRRALESAANEAFAPHAGRNGLALLPFDGGLELRAADRTKRQAAEALLAAANDPSASAFLGDDTTDEDAFAAVRAAGGLPLLVREPPRASYAPYVLRPPEALLSFLDDWIRWRGTEGTD